MRCVISSKFGTTFEKTTQKRQTVDYTVAPILFFPVYSYLIAYRPGTDPLADFGHCARSREVQKV